MLINIHDEITILKPNYREEKISSILMENLRESILNKDKNSHN